MKMINILLIEDCVDTCLFVKKLLHIAGYSVIICNNGFEALNFLFNCSNIIPDLILLDVTLPGLNGYEVAKRVKNNPPFNQIPIIFFSSRDLGELREKAKEIGVEGIISKPFLSNEFLNMIKNLVRQHTFQESPTNCNIE